MSSLAEDQRRSLAVFVRTYLGEMTSGSFQDIVSELKSLPERLREIWSRNIGFGESVVNLVLKKFDLEAIDLPNLEEEKKNLSASYRTQLEMLRQISRELGFRSIYVLIDRVDETEKTGNSAEKAYALVQPLLKDLELLGLKGYGFKFFLWDQILPYFRHDARPDRIPQFSLRWSRQGLQGVLSKRVQAFSQRRVQRFADLLEPRPGYDADEVVCLLANGSPRNVIRICERILSVQAEADPLSTHVTPNALERGIELYCEQMTVEVYGEERARDIQRVGRELFTINYLANDVFKKTHENTSRNKVTNWTEIGLVKQIGSISVEGNRRPLNFYYVADPGVVRLIHRAVPLGAFLQDRWLVCSHCSHDNLQDIALIPDGNDPVCHGCGHALM